MTVPTIRSKRSEGPVRLSFAAVLMASYVGLLAPSLAQAAKAALPRLPVIQTVGVLPVQWEGETPSSAKPAIDEGFPAAVRASHKFRVLNDELVSGLWQDQEGRTELRTQYEMQAFIGLTVTVRDDVATLTARLTDGALKSELLETDTVTPDWLASASSSDIKRRVEILVYRLVNRLPVDVSVTSVQGKFLTLSGGSDQHIEVGDRVDLVRTGIRSTHPANGTWLEFKKQPLGTAQVIEVKTYNCVAKITSQTYERAIEVGDGARIAALASREEFSRLAANDGLQDGGNQETIIVQPIYNGEAPTKPVVKAAPKDPAKPKPKPVAPPPDPEQAPPVEVPPAPEDPASEAAPQADEVPVAPGSVAPEEAPPEASNNQASTADTVGSFLEELTNDAASHKLVDEINAYAGPYWWRLSGSKLPGTSGKVPFYLLNSVGGGITHTLLYKIKTAFGGGLIEGKTAHGTYLGYQGYGRIYWEDSLVMGGGLLGGWKAGGLASLSGMSVQQEAFGGGDWIRGGGFGGLFGKFMAAEAGRFEWFSELSVMPLVFGRAGFSGNRQQTQSSFGYLFALGVYQDRPAKVVAWGGGFDLGNEVETLGDARQPRYQTYQLKVLAKIGL